MRRPLVVGAVSVSLAVLVGVIVFAKFKDDLQVSTVGVGQVEAQVPDPTAADPVIGAFADKPVVECGSVELPESAETEFNTVFDPVSRVIEIDYYDGGLGATRTIFVSADDPTCERNPRAKKLVDSVLASHARVLDRQCLWMEEIVRTGIREVRGNPVNPEAARRFVERWCRK